MCKTYFDNIRSVYVWKNVEIALNVFIKIGIYNKETIIFVAETEIC